MKQDELFLSFVHKGASVAKKLLEKSSGGCHFEACDSLGHGYFFR